MELKAGRELDALVAEKVMGEERPVERRGSEWGWTVPSEGTEARKRMEANGERLFWDPLLEYSTDITAAFEAVDRLVEQGFTFNLCYSPEERGWAASFETPAGDVFASPEWIPRELAVCLAALKAVGAL